MSNHHLVELPISINEKYNILKQRFIGEDEKYIKYLSELQSLRYLINQPIFVIFYIEGDRLLSKSVSCTTLRIESIKTSPFPDCFVLYSLQSMNGLTYVRGSYIKYDGEAHRKMRDIKIDEITGSQ